MGLLSTDKDAKEREKAKEAERARREQLRKAVRRGDAAEIIRLGGTVVVDKR